MTAGLAVMAGAALLGAAAAGLAAGTTIGSAVLGGATATQAAQAVGTAAFLSGSMYVGSQALSDMLSGRLSSTDTYIRRALAGSIVGIFSGASTLMLADAGLLATMGSGFAEGFAGEAVTQKLLNENGEIDWAQCIRSGVFTAVMDGGLYAMRSGSKTSIEEEANYYDNTNVMFRKKRNFSVPEPMPKKQLQKIVKAFKRQGGIIQMDDATDAYLKSKMAEGITLNENTILLQQNPSRASVFEELIHATQYRKGLNDGSVISRLENEIAAQKKLLLNSNAYKLTALEIKQTESALTSYMKELQDLLGG